MGVAKVLPAPLATFFRLQLAEPSSDASTTSQSIAIASE
jgi:hypothetical protein